MDTRLLLACIVAGVTLVALFLFFKMVSALTGNLGKRETNPKSGTPGEQIELHSMYAPVPGCGGTVSPFTTKVEAYLRMMGLKYKTKPTSLKSSPNGRIPWMQHGQHKVADSRFIIRFLQNTYGTHMKDIREPEDAVGQALSTTIQRLCDQHIYFTKLYHAAATPQGRARAPKLFMAFVPWPMNEVAARAWWIGRSTQLRYQGLLTSSDQDINSLIAEDFAALAALLGDKTYFLGSGTHPSAADACVFGFLEAHTHGTGLAATTPVSSAARKHQNLVRFVDNIQKTYFADRLQKGFKMD